MAKHTEKPSVEEQKNRLGNKLNKTILEGENWYIIDLNWLHKMLIYIGLRQTGSKEISYPGPIDNRALIDKEKHVLRTGLLEHHDFDCVPEEVWNNLVEWYGLEEGQLPLERKAIKRNDESVFVEIYLVDLKCYKRGKNNCVDIKASRSDKLRVVGDRLKENFKIPLSKEIKLWKNKEEYGDSLNLDMTILEAELDDSHAAIVIDVVDNEKFNDQCSNTIPQRPPCNYKPDAILAVRSRQPIASSSALTRTEPGLCGLNNLGNTCFMNSVLQCMSNVPTITEYFLASKHLAELNESNPLGMRGEIAKAYGELIACMWSGKCGETTPNQFKLQVGKFNPSFNGGHQHDSQELLTFLLDGLHEDLNRIKQKPYIEISNQAGKDDAIAAQEAWNNYKKRNDSVIVDTFHGLLKSTVICPECERMSVTFDPFCYLSLPLPYKIDRTLTIIYVPFDGSKGECSYRLTMARKDTIRELCRAVAAKTKIPQDHMLVAEISQNHFHKFYGNEDSIENIDEKDVINVFELPIVPSLNDKDTMIVPVCFWEICKPNDKYVPKHLFGLPFLITIPQREMSFNDLHNKLLEKMQRHFSLPTAENSTLSGPDSNLEDKLKGCSLNVPSSDFGIFYMDSATDDEPIKLQFKDESCNVSELLGNDPNRYGRKVLILQFTADQRREFYREKPIAPNDIMGSHNYNKEKGKISINDCMSLFTTCEKLGADDAWYCPVCKKHQRATKKFDLCKLPKILIVHLKRFSYTRCRRDKIDTLVDFPITDLSLDTLINVEGPRKVYDLIGVCNHYGHMGGGHYTAYCKNKNNEKWYNFDDSIVDQISSEKILSAAAYVLFYIAKDCNQDAMETN